MPNIQLHWAEIYEKLKELLDLEKIKKEINDLKGIKIYRLPKELLDVAIAAISTAEYIVAEIMSMESGGGDQKRKAVVKFLDDVFNVPFWLEPFDGILIGIGVDMTVTAINTFLNKQWGKSPMALKVRSDYSRV